MYRFVVLSIVSLALSFKSSLCAQQRASDRPESKWETLADCELVTNAVLDGDSFHVLHDGREYIFRLYFVDAPEQDSTLKDRIEDQAAYFGIATGDITRAGKLASQFTRDMLSTNEFTIITRWQNGLGRSSLARFYAVVLVGTNNLAEELVVNGLARIYGVRANWPDGPRSVTFINKLKNLEIIAREQQRGLWNKAGFARVSGAPVAADKISSSPSSASLVDINNASYEELRTLPGIGPKLAERIMAHRPFKTIEQLDDVPGIGPVTIDRLRPLIQIEKVSP
jgi:competence ComEA-like helix-hairpin-helix protein